MEYVEEVWYHVYDWFSSRPQAVHREFTSRFADSHEHRLPGHSRHERPRQYFSDNIVITSRYNIITFIPRSLFEQFRRLANIYFLGMGILMLLGTYTQLFDSPISPWSTLVTLAIVLSISMGKEGIEDIKRHRADAETNSQPTQRLNKQLKSSSPLFDKTEWKHVKVGNIVKISNNEEVPADVILLTTSEAFGNAYVETSNIDGETNLKLKTSVKMTEHGPKWSAVEPWQTADITVKCELPNSSILHFNGTIIIDGQECGIDSSSLLLRGCVLKNTNWALGIVVYTGKQSKVVMNSRKVPSKLSVLEKTMNSLIYTIFMTQVILSFVSFITYIIWLAFNKHDLTYLCFDSSKSVNPILFSLCDEQSEYNEMGYFVTFFILYNNFIPLSLYVTVEMCNYFQAYFIDNDIALYHKDSDTPAMARTSNMNSDLGMVEYIFSDKTGTLTDNVMKFRMCSIAGIVYSTIEGKVIDDEQFNGEEKKSDVEAVREQALNLDDTSAATSDIPFIIKSMADLVESAQNIQHMAAEFAIILASCHTVVIDSETSELRSESPDEEALVKAAATMGWKFLKRSPNTITLSHQDQQFSFEILASIPFDSTRKRMSVVVRTPFNQIVLYCKGADNVIMERATSILPLDSTIEENSKHPMEVIQNHLKRFAREGLRTLLLSKRELSEKEFAAFHQQWLAASTSLDNRQELYAEAAALIECQLTIVGATGIEDKLQDQVPETIADLMDAGIKLWVLTGDKMETAINIGYSAKLLVPEMIVLRMSYKGDHLFVRKKLQALLYHLRQLTEEVNVRPNAAVPWYQHMANYSTDLFEAMLEWKLYSFLILNKRKRKQRYVSADMGDFELEEDHQHVIYEALSVGGEDAPLLKKPEDVVQLDQLASEHLALIVDGDTLMGIFGDALNERIFLTIASICKCVIACRVSPEQKRLMVRLVKYGIYPRPVTLAIGDGANDVAMIQEAQIGIGISGKEGRQAVNSSDFAFAQFRYLKRALLVHGRWNYRRTSKVVLYSFYKNIVLSVVVFFYTFFSGYSGQSLFEDNVYSMYNIILSLPVVCFGVFDRDISAPVLMRNLVHYEIGRKQLDLNNSTIIFEIIQALVDALIIFFVPYFCYFYSMDIWALSGNTAGLWIFGTTVYTCLVAAMFLRLAFITSTWTSISHLCFWGSIVIYFCFLYSYQFMYQVSYNFYGITNEMMGHPMFWWILLAVSLSSILLKAALVKSRRWLFPSNYDTINEIECELEARGLYDANGMKIGSTSREEQRDRHAGQRPKYPLNWNLMKRWFGKMSTREQETLGMQNMENGPTSSYNYDHVSTSLGPGAGIQYFFKQAKNMFTFRNKSTDDSPDQQASPAEEQNPLLSEARDI